MDKPKIEEVVAEILDREGWEAGPTLVEGEERPNVQALPPIEVEPGATITGARLEIDHGKGGTGQ